MWGFGMIGRSVLRPYKNHCERSISRNYDVTRLPWGAKQINGVRFF